MSNRKAPSAPSGGNGRNRSAISGRFVTSETVRRHPRTTVTEKPKPNQSKKRK
ncbi:hypothetical protein HNR25_003912 [Streptomonospora salina]|uniref:Uncharacterized protein n=1 Tax=Streptomonospora salina TaxID=104205 RepID=A0A841EL91_9ACTN|nr:hypothetical protein [Streptomonospora salina]